MDLEALELARPGLVPLAIPALVFVAVLALVGWARVRPLARPLLPFLRAALVVGLVAALAGPLVRETVLTSGRVAVALDASASLAPASRRLVARDAATLLARAREQDPGAARSLRLFADGVLDAADLVDADAVALEAALDALPPARRDASDPRTAILPSPPGAAAEVAGLAVLFGDGAWAPPPRLLAAPNPGAAALVLAPRDRPAALTALGLDVPAEIVAGEPLALALRYRSDVARRVALRVRVDDELLEPLEVALEAGTGRLPIDRVLRLAPGEHVVEAAFDPVDDVVEDDAARARVVVHPRRRPLIASGAAARGAGTRDLAPARALAAQEIEHDRIEVAELPREAAGYATTSMVLLDRVAPDEIGPEAAAALAAFVADGGGLMLAPDSGRDAALAFNEGPLAALLPLRFAPAPPPPPEPEPETPRPEDEEPPKKLEDPDPERSREEEVDAPTLTVLLLIDKSPSMSEGSRLTFAKKGAVATARRLHPEDRIGVISYNELPTETLPIQPAGDLAAVEDAVSRIQPGGRATDVRRALDLAHVLLALETSAVKTVIVLSDGYTIPFDIEGVLAPLVADGISVSTVGVGSTFDFSTLTSIAVAGRGTGAIPARTAREIPAVLVDVTSALQKKHGTRPPVEPRPEAQDDGIARPDVAVPEAPRDPEPRPEPEPRPAPAEEKDARGVRIAELRGLRFTAGLDWRAAPPLGGLHRAEARDGAWVSLATADAAARPVLAHWTAGEGRVAAFAVPLEGPFAGDLPLWDGYAPFLAQLVRHLERDPAGVRFAVTAEAGTDLVLVAVDDAASRVDGAWTFALAGRDGPVAIADVTTPARGLRLLRTARPLPADGATLTATPPAEGATPLAVELVPGLAPERRVDPEGEAAVLASWRAALGAEIVAAGAPLPEPPAPGASERRVPAPRAWLGWLAALFLVELVARRLGRRPEALA